MNQFAAWVLAFLRPVEFIHVLPEAMTLLLLVVWFGSGILLCYFGHSTFKIGICGIVAFVVAYFCLTHTWEATKGTVLRVPIAVFPAAITVALLFGVLSLFRQATGLEQPSKAHMRVMALLTSAVGSVILGLGVLCLWTRQVAVVVPVVAIAFVTGILVQFNKISISRPFRSYDMLYKLPLPRKLPDYETLADSADWGKPPAKPFKAKGV